MQPFPFELDYYVTTEGERPFKEWLDGLPDIRARAKIRVRLDRVRLGNLGDNEPVGDGVRELKIDYGPGYRVYFANQGKRIILLLSGGDKGSQKKDIAKAREFLVDYKRREKHV